MLHDVNEARKQLGRHGKGVGHACGPAERWLQRKAAACGRGHGRVTGEADPEPLWPSGTGLAWWLTGMGWSGVGLGHSDTALTAAFTCRLQLPSGPAECGPAQCGLPRGPAERLERLVSDCESASAAGSERRERLVPGREAACAAGERVWVLCGSGSSAVGGGVAREAVECRCHPPREVQGRWEAKCAAVRLGRRGGPARMDAGRLPSHLELPISVNELAQRGVNVRPAARRCGFEPASTIVSSGALGGSPTATRLIFACRLPCDASDGRRRVLTIQTGSCRVASALLCPTTGRTPEAAA